jgi:hypothetical protein
MAEKNTLQNQNIDPHHLDPALTPDDIANLAAANWDFARRDVARVELPFKLRMGNPNVQHLLTSQEYIVVRSKEPYNPPAIWEGALKQYTLPKVSEANEVSVFTVPPDLITLPAIMNDALEGDPEVMVDAFSKVGEMFKDIASVYADEGKSITSWVNLGDIAFVKGRTEPVILPPFSLDIHANGNSPAHSLAAEIFSYPATDEQHVLLQEAMQAFEDSYGSSS